MRKHVKPADPKATIPDPERRGDLRPEGRAVPWSAHWARLAARGDVIVTEIDAAAGSPAKGGEPAAEPEVAPEPETAPEPHSDA